MRLSCNLSLRTQALKSMGYHKVFGKMMRLGNTGVKIHPNLLLPALKVKMSSAVVIFFDGDHIQTHLYAVVRLSLWTFFFGLFHPCACTLFGRGTGCMEISTGLTSSHYSCSSSRNSDNWKDKKIICGTQDFLSDK